MKQADSFGRDFTVYLAQVEEEKTEKPAISTASKITKKTKRDFGAGHLK